MVVLFAGIHPAIFSIRRDERPQEQTADVLVPPFRYFFISAFHALPAASTPLVPPHPRAKESARTREKGRQKERKRNRERE